MCGGRKGWMEGWWTIGRRREEELDTDLGGQ